MRAGKFYAVDIHGLREHLGMECSPDPWRSGYVIGPDNTGRICHVANCRNMEEARRHADKLNEAEGQAKAE